MVNDLKSILKEEIFLHLTLRQEELSSEAFRHNKRTVYLFDVSTHSWVLPYKEIRSVKRISVDRDIFAL